ncbi:phosphate acyltransferase PlsX [Chthonobacter rhizosphaerae]|uniref:phosphate acyltransferase PlsX n=1 Tax=Chthonobacter rhizosphaerae TaxID=2735553 RepID=UPI0015EF61DF|nr:phosphate acyltransferase PlsX [Chthonobacter rhizosphaerae]
MAQAMIISVDVMGGDHGPSVVIPGCDLLLSRRPDVRFALFGDEAVVRPLLDKHPRVREASTFTHCEVTVGMDEKPSQALRHGRRTSSMWKAIEVVKRGEANVAVSAGNTGALMAMSKICLRGLAGIERPAIAAIWPTLRAESIVLDVGATVGADAQQLMDFAVMGGAMARALFQVESPTIGLLNIGVEEMKGNEEVRAAGQLLRESNLPNLTYMGFVEGDDIGQGKVDVIVTEGFAGNIALKTAEGTARQVGAYLRAAMSRTLFARIGYLFARTAFQRLRDKMDPRKLNGGVFLGLNGIIIKSHGGTDAEGFASALDLGFDMVRNDLMAKINADLSVYHRGRLGVANVEP